MEEDKLYEYICIYVKQLPAEYDNQSNAKKVSWCFDKISKLHDMKEYIKDRELFLYKWFCAISALQDDPKISKIQYSIEYGSMSQYTSFTQKENIKNMTYRNFTQMYAAQNAESDIETKYEFLSEVQLYHKYPISLLSMMDRIQMPGRFDIDHVILCTQFSYMIKHNPKILSGNVTDLPNLKMPLEDTLAIYGKTFHSTSDYVSSKIIIKDYNLFSDILNYFQQLVNSYDKYTEYTYHKYIIADNGTYFEQLSKFFSKYQTGVSISGEKQEISLSSNIYECDVIISNKILQGVNIFNIGDISTYKMKGDTILEIYIYSNKGRTIHKTILNKILSILKRDENIEKELLYDKNISNINRLRASNARIFNLGYSTYCPPLVQPQLIKPSEVKKYRENGFMILQYEHKYYTTFVPIQEGGYCFIGLKQHFGGYDPNKIYAPIIRTYKKNHLHGTKYKELKSYLLRNSSDISRGKISEEDLILPEAVRGYYNIDIINEQKTIHDTQTKKSKIKNKVGISRGELPYIIKELISPDNPESCFRVIIEGYGTKLLDIFNIDKYKFFEFVKDYIDLLPDLAGKTAEDVYTDIINDNIVHEIYGKLIEYYAGISILVFNIDGIIPYRYSDVSTDGKIQLLFMTENNTYDIINSSDTSVQNLSNLVKSMNNLKTISLNVIKDRVRDTDFVKTFMSIIFRLFNILTDLYNNYEIIAEPIHILECEDLLERIYSKCIPMETWIRKDDSYVEFSEQQDKNKNIKIARNLLKVNIDYELLSYIFEDILQIKENIIRVKSIIRFDKCHKFKLLMENALYADIRDFKYDGKVEIFIYQRD